ncbi:MAG: histidine phosphatase family protein [Treponema sp.]|nr:histidine phosphatase family protein [Treponema sp.]
MIDLFSGLKHQTDIYIIRHGQSEGNAAQILQGRMEYLLSEQGRLQSVIRGKALKEELKGEQVLFYSSPQGRAKETAGIISEEAGLGEPVLVDELMEMSLGIWTGKTWDEVRNDDSELWESFMVKSWDAIPEAESSNDLYKRASNFWTKMCSTVNEKEIGKVLIITHGGFIQWLLKSTFQCNSWFPMFPISNCGQNKLCIKPNSSGKNPYMAWEEIDASIKGLQVIPTGFPA